jgi:hypothetical protein
MMEQEPTVVATITTEAPPPTAQPRQRLAGNQAVLLFRPIRFPFEEVRGMYNILYLFDLDPATFATVNAAFKEVTDTIKAVKETGGFKDELDAKVASLLQEITHLREEVLPRFTARLKQIKDVGGPSKVPGLTIVRRMLLTRYIAEYASASSKRSCPDLPVILVFL